MADLPNNKTALRRMATAGRSAAKRAAAYTADRKEGRNEILGAMIVLPLVRDVSKNFTFLSNLGLNEKLQTAAISYAASMFTKGMLSDVAWGATVGAIGAYAYESDGLLGGIFGK